MFKYFIVFMINLIIELIVLFVLGYRTRKHSLAVISVNCITHPIITLLIYVAFLKNIYSQNLVYFLEIIVVLSEWKLLEMILEQKSYKLFKLALSMNVSSYILGMCFTKILF